MDKEDWGEFLEKIKKFCVHGNLSPKAIPFPSHKIIWLRIHSNLSSGCYLLAPGTRHSYYSTRCYLFKSASLIGTVCCKGRSLNRGTLVCILASQGIANRIASSWFASFLFVREKICLRGWFNFHSRLDNYSAQRSHSQINALKYQNICEFFFHFRDFIFH